MAHLRFVLSFLLAISSILFVHAADEDMLQDFCVADNGSKIKVNGVVCKAAADVKAEDFKSSLLATPGNTDNKLGSNVTLASVNNFPGLNTFGVAFARVDYAPGGTNPPHVHPRGSELLFLVHGNLLVGFVTTLPDNKLFAQMLYPGDLFVFPRGLVHFQLNVGKEPAVAMAGFNSQNPGATQVAKAVFDSNPPINDDVIAKAFQIDDRGLIQKLRELIGMT
ncbi:putative germin-like protein 2-1 [Selaginella moellendorffii]|uniref:putative germin-like protein 2-1 n=1 Tax=Selaginella moellendorffii TaxID=88036 RepID=UPI000D1CDC8B|nr:putative germin-like protein 2-1 [Selaginella moellendorffii]XP_024520706.1 putative germin-like protein 2-1 [Selaginella moellendorffii]XP_024520763.1 putative germin-like protein 2-1 [Selaginella moellendorffii]XP_024520792.1 putative germin-like protein 2-1 [Selaginella moellendorffii]XP_024520793.1 putative germin-like protein 2-1 [Selaginella moellendorffii]XP_024520795.1 putative germin-like protein 2-1 [Selaginella moellendorffii]XP_024523740.1 putative germin-like protein 2-1 [Sela|eukprot:XP_024520700.1 putative germin-like protein 2-1 [Selaginella moellendorffii]